MVAAEVEVEAWVGACNPWDQRMVAEVEVEGAGAYAPHGPFEGPE